MKRREAIRLFPISLAGMTGMAQQVFGGEMKEKEERENNDEPLAMQYSKKVRERLTWIRQNQTENLMEAAHAIARTVENGGQCYQVSWDAGHTEADSWPGRNGEPEIFSTAFDINKAKKGDLLLTSGQTPYTEELGKKGIFLIGCPSPWSGDARFPELLRDDIKKLVLRPYADIYIENQATTLGGVVNVPGMPAPIGPVSGITGKTTIWMMLADACRTLARKGLSRPVKGDEPILKGGDKPDYRTFAGWAKLNDPLMDDYFNEVMKQLEMVFAELGTIRKIAKISVDSVLNGGKIYGYSLHSSIAGEASTRRSGLSITEGVYGSTMDTPEKRKNFRGTSKDCVIMGITKPDDPTDLAFLDMFRQRGMKVASLGPMTRSIQVPKGRTVPKETDFHAGRMCDTYGLFAVPGFEQRICPTSGVVLDHLFWCTMLEVVEQYIDRTGGDVPGVYYSAALKGGMEHMYRMLEVYRDRGK
ncbi:MAG: hypothetical protein Q8O92_05770 [Candidatus Latescibacter sp.]|nr:hypothetical protein [Candidatus Latescibacter sp.]